MLNTQKYVEIHNHNKKTTIIDTFENIGLIYNETLEDNLTENGYNANQVTDADDNNKLELTKDLNSNQKLIEVTNKSKPNNPNNIELPKINIETLKEYPICYTNYKLPINYIKY